MEIEILEKKKLKKIQHERELRRLKQEQEWQALEDKRLEQVAKREAKKAQRKVVAPLNVKSEVNSPLKEITPPKSTKNLLSIMNKYAYSGLVKKEKVDDRFLIVI